MNKLDMQSKDIVNENIEKISELFPNVIIESEMGKLIDFDLLKQELSKELIEGNKEKYQLTWPGKKEAIVNANTQCNKTLRPLKGKSVKFDETKNVYIEGDNLDVLKLLQNSYLNKIKCIFIDPPYNTGNDFIYNDKFVNENELNESGQIDEYNNKLISNQESNGKFHSDWLTMMYSRLKLSRNLLSEDGVIFISIDENECANLRKICDEIFGEKNFVSNFIWQSRTSISNDYEVSLNHNHILIYSKKREKLLFGGDKIDESEYINPDNDPRGPWKLVPIDANHVGGDTLYPVTNPYNGVDYYPPNGRIWCYNRETMKRLIEDNRIKFGINNDSSPKRKLFLYERLEKGDKKTPSSLLMDVGTTKDGTVEIMNLFDGEKVFDYPKSVELMKRLISYGAPNGGIVMDFFSGSSTTAQAVLEIINESDVDLSFIMVQLPENLEESLKKCSTSAKKTIESAIKYLKSVNRELTIADLAQERILKVLNKNKYSNGFRVYKLDSSNMKDIYYAPDKLKQTNLFEYISNIKDDRNSDDLLIQVILDLGLTLDLKIEEKVILNNKIYFVDENSLIACFDSEIDINVVDEICKYNPIRVVFKDESFKFDNDKINLQERLKKMSPNIEICIL